MWGRTRVHEAISAAAAPNASDLLSQVGQSVANIRVSAGNTDDVAKTSLALVALEAERLADRLEDTKPSNMLKILVTLVEQLHDTEQAAAQFVQMVFDPGRYSDVDVKLQQGRVGFAGFVRYLEKSNAFLENGEEQKYNQLVQSLEAMQFSVLG